MFCPLRSGSEDSDCLRDLCEWWLEGKQACSVTVIAMAMAEIQEYGVALDKRED